ncbi:MAG: hypothetical protein AB7P00_08420 [Sandaracinaceae bacterium]
MSSLPPTAADSAVCRTCGEPHAAARGDGGVCPACAAGYYPPITDRAGSWSPLQLGVMSLLCDVLLIPTVLALVRGVRDLREVARREAFGLYRDEHAEVRTSAIAGMSLAALRPAIVLLVVFVAATQPPYDHAAPSPPSELHEVLADLVGDAPHDCDFAGDVSEACVAQRELALVHLRELAGPQLTSADEDELYALLDRPALASAADEPRIRGAVVHAALRAMPARYNRLAVLARQFDRIDEATRNELLRAAAQTPDPALDLLRGMLDAPSHPQVPVDELLESLPRAERYLPGLFEVDWSPAQLDDLTRVAAAACEAQPSLRFTGMDEGLITAWTRAREDVASLPEATTLVAQLDPERVRVLLRGERALSALSCTELDHLSEMIESSTSELDDAIEVQAQAAIARERLGDRMTRADLERFAADRRSRARLYRHLLRFEPARIQWAWDDLHPAAEAEGEVFAWLRERGLVASSLRQEAFQSRILSEDGPEQQVFLFVVETDAGTRHVAVGPYSDPSMPPEIVPAGEALDADWGGVRAAQLVERVLDRAAVRLVPPFRGSGR